MLSEDERKLVVGQCSESGVGNIDERAPHETRRPLSYTVVEHDAGMQKVRLGITIEFEI